MEMLPRERNRAADLGLQLLDESIGGVDPNRCLWFSMTRRYLQPQRRQWTTVRRSTTALDENLPNFQSISIFLKI
jgi:hypothetical protein